MTDSEKLDYIIEHLHDVPGADYTQNIFITDKKIDWLCRITIPKALRKELQIEDGDTLKIFRGQNEIIIKKGWQIKKVVV